MSPEELAKWDGIIESSLSIASPEALPPPLRDALKKYGSWKNVPRAEKDKILALGPKLLEGMLGGLGDINNALAGGDPFAEVFDGLDGEPAKPAGKAWFDKVVDLKYPDAFDPKKVNASMFVGWAQGQATQLYPDAKLTYVAVGLVNANAIADVTGDGADIELRYIVPGRPDGECFFKVYVDETGAHAGPISGFKCEKQVKIAAPRCSLLAVWQRAIKAGVDSSKPATLLLHATTGTTMWNVFPGGVTNIDPATVGKTLKAFPDDCGAGH